MVKTKNGPGAALTARDPADTPQEGIDMQQPTTTNSHYDHLVAELRVLCDAYHYATVRTAIEAICAEVAGTPSKTS